MHTARRAPEAHEVAEVVAGGEYEVCPGCGDYVRAGRVCGRAMGKLLRAIAEGRTITPTGYYNVDLEPDDLDQARDQDQREEQGEE